VRLLERHIDPEATMKMRMLCFAIAMSLSWAVSAAPKARQEFAQVLAAKPDATRGEELFGHCVSCHGPDAGGEVAGSTPRIAGQHFRVLARQLVDFRHGKRWDFRMEGIAKSHEILPRVQDIADVAWYVSTLDRDGARGVGDGQNVARGLSLYVAQCASCHGGKGEGDDQRGIPLLAGQHAGYLSRQIYDAVDGRRPPLGDTHRKRFAPLAFEDVLALSDYLSRLGWAGAATADPD
jgi:cytochrome c553